MRTPTLRLTLVIAAALALSAHAAAQEPDWVEGENPLPEIRERTDIEPFEVNATVEADTVILTWEPIARVDEHRIWVTGGPFPTDNEDDWRRVDVDVEPADGRDGALSARDVDPPMPQGQAQAIEYVVVAYDAAGAIVGQGAVQVDPALIDPGTFRDSDDFPAADEPIEAEGATGSFVLVLILLVAIAIVAGAVYAISHIGRR